MFLYVFSKLEFQIKEQKYRLSRVRGDAEEGNQQPFCQVIESISLFSLYITYLLIQVTYINIQSAWNGKVRMAQ